MSSLIHIKKAEKTQARVIARLIMKSHWGGHEMKHLIL